MKYYLLISVYQSDVCKTKDKAVFKRLLYLESIDELPYSSIRDTLSFLYGSRSIIVFETGLSAEYGISK